MFDGLLRLLALTIVCVGFSAQNGFAQQPIPDSPQMKYRRIHEVNGLIVYASNNASDALPEVWKVSYSGHLPFRATIFDRWGLIVYESNDADEAWDGNMPDGKACQQGLYLYLVEIGTRKVSGEIDLLR